MKNIKIVLGTAVITALPVSQITALEHSKNSKPNIIYILADDMGRAEIKSYGQQLIETPNIDRLAGEGMTFNNHYSGAPVSAPSRCMLFTGLHSGHAYIRGNDPMAERGAVWSHQAMLDDPSLEGQRPLPSETVMIPAKLKEAGYTTACIGKWGLGYPNSTSTPTKMGFDYFYGYNCQRLAHTYYPPFLYRNDDRVYLNNKVIEPNVVLDKKLDSRDEKNYEQFQQKDYAPDIMYSEILNFVNQQSKDKPFALFWTTPLPHVPLQAPQKWIDYYVNKFGDETPYLGEGGYFPARYPRATYAAMMSYFDEQIGGLIAKLKEQGLYENTLIVFTSDNGPTFNGGSDSPWFDSAKPFKAEYGWGKASLREGGIRAPMIAVWKNKIQAGSASDLLCAFWDMMPTLCEVAEVQSPETDGISFIPELLGKKQKQHDFLYWEFADGNGTIAVRIGKWKGLIEGLFEGKDEMKLYDLELDPREQTDMARYHPEIISEIRTIMNREHTEPQVKKFSLKKQ